MVARTLLGVSLALTVAGCGAAGGDSPPEPTGVATQPVPTTPAPAGRGAVRTGRVLYVSDGDTIGVDLDGIATRVRLLGIDAPETKHPDEPVACYGPQASARAAALMPKGAAVTVLTDPSQDQRDRFGRLLGYVFRAGGHTPVNETLLREGAARLYVFRPNRPFRRVDAFRRAEAEARAARRGLWERCPNVRR